MCVHPTGPHCYWSDKTRAQEENAFRDQQNKHPRLDTSRETCKRKKSGVPEIWNSKYNKKEILQKALLF